MASMAYWLQVGVKRHEGEEGGDAELIEADGKDEDKAEEALHDSCAAMLVRSFSILR